jgi:hypothetical protein
MDKTTPLIFSPTLINFSANQPSSPSAPSAFYLSSSAYNKQPINFIDALFYLTSITVPVTTSPGFGSEASVDITEYLIDPSALPFIFYVILTKTGILRNVCILRFSSVISGVGTKTVHVLSAAHLTNAPVSVTLVT